MYKGASCWLIVVKSDQSSDIVTFSPIAFSADSNEKLRANDLCTHLTLFCDDMDVDLATNCCISL